MSSGKVIFRFLTSGQTGLQNNSESHFFSRSCVVSQASAAIRVQVFMVDLRIYQYKVVSKIFWSRKASHSQAMPWKRLPSTVPEKSTAHHLRKKQYWVRMARGQITCYFLSFSHSFPQRDHLHWMITQNGNTFLPDIIRWKNICLLEFQEIIWNKKWPAWLAPKKQFKRSREMAQVGKEWRNRLCLQSGCVG